MSRITKIELQKNDKNRVNVYVDDIYCFSLLKNQLIDLKINQTKDYNSDQINSLKEESIFGILYQKALLFCLDREHSQKEVHEYLIKKISKISDAVEKQNKNDSLFSRIENELLKNSYINDEKFCDFWIEYRNLRKGISQRKIVLELRQKGISDDIIQKCLNKSNRNDKNEIKKIILRKKDKYKDDNKLIKYLLSQGFSYYDIKEAMQEADSY